MPSLTVQRERRLSQLSTVFPVLFVLNYLVFIYPLCLKRARPYAFVSQDLVGTADQLLFKEKHLTNGLGFKLVDNLGGLCTEKSESQSSFGEAVFEKCQITCLKSISSCRPRALVCGF